MGKKRTHINRAMTNLLAVVVNPRAVTTWEKAMSWFKENRETPQETTHQQNIFVALAPLKLIRLELVAPKSLAD